MDAWKGVYTMQKKISARHFDLSDDLKEKAEAEMDSLTRYYDHIISADLVLDMERHRRLAELKVSVYNQTLTASAESDDMVNSIATAVDKVRGQLLKYKGKLKDKKPDEIVDAKDAVTKPMTNDDELDI